MASDSDPGRARTGVLLPALHFTATEWDELSSAFGRALSEARREAIQDAVAYYVAIKLDERTAAPDSALAGVAAATDQLLRELLRVPREQRSPRQQLVADLLPSFREETRGRDRGRGRPRDEGLLTSVYLLALIWEAAHSAWPRRSVARISGQERGTFTAFVEAAFRAGIRAAKRQGIAESEALASLPVNDLNVGWAVRSVLPRRRGMEKNHML